MVEGYLGGVGDYVNGRYLALGEIKQSWFYSLVLLFIISLMMTIAFSVTEFINNTVDKVGPMIVYFLPTLVALFST